MSVAPDDFRQALARFASGVTIVTTMRDEDIPLGVTVSAFSSVSLEPPLVLVCLDQYTQHLTSYLGGKHFNISILEASQSAISNRFASQSDTSPFDDVPHFAGENGVPLISEALVSIECAYFSDHVAGDHTILIGEVQKAYWEEEGAPLIYWRSQYRALASEDNF